jgi:hypothetical protein
MENKIIHMKIPLDSDGNISIKYNTMQMFYNAVKEALPKDYIIVATPFDTTSISGSDLLITIDSKEYSYNELKDIIEKSEMYNGLCK